MKFFRIILALSAALIASATTVSVSYDPIYDTATTSMDSVACSDGSNGLITKYGWKTFGAIPHFPSIGGSSTIPGWNAATCGQCFQLTYTPKTGPAKSIFFLAIDTAPSGVNIAKAAMNKLTGGQAVALGRVNAAITKVGVAKCGLTPKRSIEFNA